METAKIFGCVSEYENKTLKNYGWDSLVQIMFYCKKPYEESGYYPMSELLRFLTNWEIGGGGMDEQLPLEVKFSVFQSRITAIYQISLEALIGLADSLEHARICGGAFPIQIIGVDGYKSIWIDDPQERN